MHRMYRDLKRAVESTGAKVNYMGSPSGGHIHVKVVAQDGREHTFVAAKTPSCSHSMKNFLSDLRRWVRGAA